ncbi:hypothetical protein HK099_005235 [Clydaea vesicula]|uniref:ethanolamine kinase n=1 Tax=Clydaea vesicula TaxID=447962 RepID=A0AAD5U8E2_9FUNG|nr:hypothetical protein HK099_005235 [Clydaea vesicula]KAJ3396975.1 hypothetical protein HDU92_001266 [Lobulomyces angularis]
MLTTLNQNSNLISPNSPQVKIPAFKTKNDIDTYIDNIKFLNTEIDFENLFEDSKNVCLTLFPELKITNIQLVECKDGITNKLIKFISSAENRDDIILLIRTYGKKSEVLIDRHQELVNLVTLSSLNLSAPIYGRFENGIVYGYIPGEVFSVDDLSDKCKSKLVAKTLAQWHHTELPGVQKKPLLFKTLKKWVSAVPEKYSNEKVQFQFEEFFDIKLLNKELSFLEKELSQYKDATVFSHNDLLSGNIILQRKSNSVTFIDYEYGCYNYRGFDISNHFNEFAGFDCDYKKYPNLDFQRFWCREYLLEFLKSEPCDTQVELLMVEVDKFSLSSHFYWCLWALVQANVSNIDFDYMTYAKLRLEEYFNRKGEVFN